MKYILIAKSTLHQLGIGISYNGYNYVLYALTLILENESLLVGITKILYIDIARRFHTTSICVERSIRRIIDSIWNDKNKNIEIIKAIFGERYLNQKPSNKVFLEMLYEYVKKYDLLCHLTQDTGPEICPFTNETCAIYNLIIQKLVNL